MNKKHGLIAIITGIALSCVSIATIASSCACKKYHKVHCMCGVTTPEANKGFGVGGKDVKGVDGGANGDTVTQPQY